MNLRSDIHAALDVVTPPAPHLAHVVMDAVRRGERPRRTPLWPRVGMGAVAGLIMLATGIGVVGLLASRSVPQPAASPPSFQPMSWSGILDAGQSSPRMALPVRFGQEVAVTTQLPPYPAAHVQVLLYDPAGRLSLTVDNSDQRPTPAWRPVPGTWSFAVRDLASRPGAAWRLRAAFIPLPVVVTTWLKDPSVTAGPYPGYRPHLSSLSRDVVAGARPVRAPNGRPGAWTVEGRWTTEGAAVFGDLTAGAAQSCPGQSCPESRVTLWAGLTQDDIDHWNERASTVYEPVSDGGDLVGDTVVVHAIADGTWLLPGDYSQQEATDVANWLGAWVGTR